jgi:hypothetical protein
MQDLTFTLVLLVLHKIEREGGIIPGLPEGLKGLFLILGIDDQGLEVKEVEALWCGW